MIFKDKEIKLKDGRTGLFRAPREEDAEVLIDYLVKSSEETNFLLRYPEECREMPVEKEKAFIRSSRESDSGTMIVCIVDGKLAGNCNVSWRNKIKEKHRAELAIALIRDYWELGIGSAMMTEMIRIAEENPDITQIELEFVEGNSRARALYEKFGFRIASVHPNAIRLKDGTLLNDYLMIREVKR